MGLRQRVVQQVIVQSGGGLAAGVTQELLLTSVGTGASTFALGGRRPLSLSSTGTSASTFTLTRQRALSLTSTGSGASTFTLTSIVAPVDRPLGAPAFGWAYFGQYFPVFTTQLSLASTGTGTSAFALTAKRALALASTGSGTSAFTMRRWRPLSLASTGSGTSTFGVNAKRALTLSSTGTGTSAFSLKAKRALAFSSTGTGTSIFKLLAAGATSYTPPPQITPADVTGWGGTVYYVKSGGSDAAAGTSPATAWATISKVNGFTFNPGDGVFFEGGTTFGTTVLSPPQNGSSGAPFVFGSYGTGRATLSEGCLVPAGRSYVTIDSLILKNVLGASSGADKNMIVTQNSKLGGFSTEYGHECSDTGDTNWQFKACEITDTRDSGIINWGDSLLVEGCTIHDVGTQYVAYAHSLHGIYSKSPNATIQFNEIYDVRDPDGQCVSTRMRNALIQGNLLRDSFEGVGFYNDDATAPGSRTTIVRYNRMLRVQNGILIDANGNTQPGMPENWVIHNNTISCSQFTGAASTYSTPLRYYNNGASSQKGTLLRVHNNILLIASGANYSIFDYQASPALATFTESNNVMRHATSGFWADFNATGCNSLAAWQTASGQGTSDLTSDPVIDTLGRPSTSSPVVDAGTTTISGVTFTLYNDRLPLHYMGAAPDIGAWEKLTGVAVAFSSTGSGTSSFTLARKRALSLSSTGTGTSTFSVTRKRALSLSSTGTGTSSFTLARKRALALTSTGAATTTFTLNTKRAFALASTGTGTSTFTLSAITPTISLVQIYWDERGDLIDPDGPDGPDEAGYPGPGTGGVGTTTFTLGTGRTLSLTSTGTGSSSYTLARLRGLSLTSTGTGTSTFTPKRIRALALTSNSVATSTFTLRDRRALAFTSTSAAATTFSVSAKRALAFNSTGAGTSSYGFALIYPGGGGYGAVMSDAFFQRYRPTLRRQKMKV